MHNKIIDNNKNYIFRNKLDNHSNSYSLVDMSRTTPRNFQLRLYEGNNNNNANKFVSSLYFNKKIPTPDLNFPSGKISNNFLIPMNIPSNILETDKYKYSKNYKDNSSIPTFGQTIFRNHFFRNYLSKENLTKNIILSTIDTKLGLNSLIKKFPIPNFDKNSHRYRKNQLLPCFMENFNNRMTIERKTDRSIILDSN